MKREMARKKKCLAGRKEIDPKINTAEISSSSMASCSQICGHVDIQLKEIKEELKGLKTMVDFAVKLLTKLVPASIDDFQNILNGSTGLTVTTVPPVVTSEADKLVIEAIADPMETEDDNSNDVESQEESPSVIVQIDSCPPSPKENTRASSRASVDVETGVENNTKLNCNKITSDFQNTGSNDVSLLTDENLKISVWPETDVNNSNSLIGSENDLSDIPAVDPLIDTDKIETDEFSNFHSLAEALQIQLSSSEKIQTTQNVKDSNVTHNSRTDIVDQEQTNSLINSIVTESHTEISPSSKEVRLESATVKEELPSEYDDTEHRLQNSDDVKIEPEGEYISGMIPECVIIKNEEICDADTAQDGNQYQIFSDYNTPASNEFRDFELGDGVSHSQLFPKNQIPSPLKPLFSSALVSKLKQKIQEKIQAAVGASNENENDDLINTKSCINLTVSFNDNCENTEQIMVAESKRRPKFYRCRSCAKIFFCTIALQAHKNFCSGLRKQFRCNSCPLIFKSRAVLFNHRRIHAKKISKKRHKCDSCGREFILKSTLKKHRQSQMCVGSRTKLYRKLPQYFCIKCGERFLNAGNLALHQKLHTIDKNFTNKAVEEVDIQKQDPPLVQANRASRRYPCAHCNEAFIDRRSVTLHEKLHTDKEFAAFDQERKLIQRKHQLMMMMQKQQQKSAEKKFGCNVCGRCYPIELLLDMHTRLHHAIS